MAATVEQPHSLPDPPPQQQKAPAPPPSSTPQTTNDPSTANGAQIPLTDFNIPTFPPEARGLRALTLTSDINTSSYQEILLRPWTIPTTLPTSIESLTLELFSLGYPPKFLSTLATRLPNLKSLVVYSQLLGGVSKEQEEDAVLAFRKWKGLRALHLLDVFAKPHFFEKVAEWVRFRKDGEGEDGDGDGEGRRGLMFLEMNYTFRHEDEEFMG